MREFEKYPECSKCGKSVYGVRYVDLGAIKGMGLACLCSCGYYFEMKTKDAE